MTADETRLDAPAAATLKREAGERHTFGNAALSLRWSIADRKLADFVLIDHAHDHALRIAEPFVLMATDGHTWRCTDFALLEPLHEDTLAADPRATSMALRRPGRRVRATLGDAAGRLRIDWSVEQRDATSWLRQRLAVTALVRDETIVSIALMTVDAPHATVCGDHDGTPARCGDWYLGIEHPLARATVEGERLCFVLRRALPLRAAHTLALAAVAGVAREGQLRRDFAAYLECERPRPYRPFLHYNSWYDIGFLTPYTQADALDRIDAVGTALHARRGVQLDGFLFDDGWDDLSGSWRFSERFPDGFVPLRTAAARHGAAPGVWLSPWGGYGPPRDERVRRGAAQGYEVVEGGFALSGPNYYRRFHEAVMALLAVDGVTHFKFDGTGNADRVVDGSRFDSDWDAAIALIGDVRAAQPATFVNLSTGTLPSPFWLLHADSIWRGGTDDGAAGEGNARERWITYRDSATWHNVVQKSPLFPLNSLMLHGVICAQMNPRLNGDTGEAFAHEVRSYFASGTQLQELYLTPALLGEAQWDVLASAARWARERASVLRDSHWIGGAPERLDVYGWAAWSAARSIVTLRNPAGTAQDFTLSLRAQLELSASHGSRFAVSVPWPAGTRRVPATLDADCPCKLRLVPFEVLTLELRPVA